MLREHIKCLPVSDASIVAFYENVKKEKSSFIFLHINILQKPFMK